MLFFPKIYGRYRLLEYFRTDLVQSSVTSFNTVAVAGLLMPVLLMDGPLLQRASNVVQRTHETWQNSTIPVTSSPFMQGVSGIMTDHESSPSLYHPLFAGVLRQYENRGTPDYECDMPL